MKILKLVVGFFWGGGWVFFQSMGDLTLCFLLLFGSVSKALAIQWKY